MLLQLRNISVCFGSTPALQGASIDVNPGEVLALMGPSGSGKSTLLQCAAGLLVPDSGSIEFMGEPLHQASDRRRTEVRRTSFGFVFQNARLVPELSAVENVALPPRLSGVPKKAAFRAARAGLDRLDVAGLGSRLPAEMSGGQAQRVAVARALVTQPKIIFADEPTGALDRANGDNVAASLFDLARESESAVLVVTHDEQLGAKGHRVVKLIDGRTQGTECR